MMNKEEDDDEEHLLAYGFRGFSPLTPGPRHLGGTSWQLNFVQKWASIGWLSQEIAEKDRTWEGG